MKIKPPHKFFAFHNKTSNHNTHRCFYIDGNCEFAFFVDEKTDINDILFDFLRNKDFVSLKEYRTPEWDHIGFIDYFPETNEVFLSTEKKYKNLITNVSTSTIYKEKHKKLVEERKEKEETENRLYAEQLEKERIKKEEKEKKQFEKMLKQKAKQEKAKSNIQKPKNILKEEVSIKTIRSLI